MFLRGLWQAIEFYAEVVADGADDGLGGIFTIGVEGEGLIETVEGLALESVLIRIAGDGVVDHAAEGGAPWVVTGRGGRGRCKTCGETVFQRDGVLDNAAEAGEQKRGGQGIAWGRCGDFPLGERRGLVGREVGLRAGGGGFGQAHGDFGDLLAHAHVPRDALGVGVIRRGGESHGHDGAP